MREFAAVGEYCERLGPGFWAEPVNFLTNVAFFIAAYAAYRRAKGRGLSGDPVLRWLLFWLVTIGIGSGLFHSLATPWAKACDVLPIAIFVLLFLGCWNRQILRLSPALNAGLFGVLAVLSGASHVLAGGPEFGGSQGYFGVWICMCGLGIDARRRFPTKPWLLYATMAFALSLVFRTIDQRICDTLPLGTHWLWHLLNAFVCYTAVAAMIDAKDVLRAR